MTSSERVHFGLKWIGLSQGLSQVIRFISTMALARLLVPEVFGLVAMAQVSIAMVGVVREAGLGSAFIQRRTSSPEEERVTASTMFVMLLVLNGLLFAATWLLAPTIAGFFRAPQVEPVLRLMFCVFLLDAVSTTPNIILQKRLDFGRLATCEIGSSVARAAIAIPLAAAGLEVWSLAFAFLGSEAVRALLLVVSSGWRPSIRFDARVGRELIGYGKFLWAFTALSTVGDSLDRLLTGRWLGASQLGVYGVALDLARLPSGEIARLVNRISFPSLALVQDRQEALQAQYSKALSHVAFLAIPVGFGMLAVAEDMILTVYGEQWREAIPVFRILAFYGLSLAISSTTGPLFKATGRPQLLLYTSILHHTLQLTLLFWLGRYGLVGIATAVVIPIALSSVVAFVLIARIMDFDGKALAGPIIRATSCALLMLVAVRVFDARVDAAWEPHVAVSLLLSSGFGFLVYLAGSALINRLTLVEFTRTIRAVITAKGDLV